MSGGALGILPKRVHSAAFPRVRIFGQESRKSEAAKDYRCLLIGIPKMAFGVRIPVERLRGDCLCVDSNSRFANHDRDRGTPR